MLNDYVHLDRMKICAQLNLFNTALVSFTSDRSKVVVLMFDFACFFFVAKQRSLLGHRTFLVLYIALFYIALRSTHCGERELVA